MHYICASYIVFKCFIFPPCSMVVVPVGLRGQFVCAGV